MAYRARPRLPFFAEFGPDLVKSNLIVFSNDFTKPEWQSCREKKRTGMSWVNFCAK